MVERRIEVLKAKVKQIQSSCECILQDIEDFEGYDELFIIEQNFERIEREAKEAVDYARETYDELEEE